MPSDERIVVVHRKTRVFDGFFKVDKVEATFSRVDGRGFIRDPGLLIFERGDSAAALVHDVDRDVIILTEQFRIPTYEKGPGWIVETVAGAIERDETPEQCIRREMLEELGYRSKDLGFISQYYVSPGGTSERIFLFYAPVHTADLVDPEASGITAERENIRRVEVNKDEFIKRCLSRHYEDAKILIAGLWLAANSMAR